MNQANTPRILIYSTPTCPDCRALKEWLSQQGIAFEERDLTDPKISAEAKSRTGVRVAPITIVGDEGLLWHLREPEAEADEGARSSVSR
ncbi:glutaredoxin family protein [Halopseudomonas pachastrellae]|nr:glutaredoxin family protein [Halopseudomonas pachastrellae]